MSAYSSCTVHAKPGALRGHASGGFTLFELLAVIALLAIVAVVAMPRAPDGAIGVRPQAEQLASDLRYAQMLSMSNGERYCVRFSGNGYSLTSAASNCLGVIAHPGAAPQPLAIRNATLTVTGLPGGYVVFDGKGAPYISVGAAPLPLPGATLAITANGTSAIVTIAAMTGLVSGP